MDLPAGKETGDGDEQAQFLARKIANLRIFEDDHGKMNKSVLDVSGSTLVVSQCTLAADTSRGNRPGFSHAAHPEEGERLYERFSSLLSDHGINVETGRFGAGVLADQIKITSKGPKVAVFVARDKIRFFV